MCAIINDIKIKIKYKCKIFAIKCYLSQIKIAMFYYKSEWRYYAFINCGLQRCSKSYCNHNLTIKSLEIKSLHYYELILMITYFGNPKDQILNE